MNCWSIQAYLIHIWRRLYGWNVTVRWSLSCLLFVRWFLCFDSNLVFVQLWTDHLYCRKLLIMSLLHTCLVSALHTMCFAHSDSTLAQGTSLTDQENIGPIKVAIGLLTLAGNHLFPHAISFFFLLCLPVLLKGFPRCAFLFLFETFCCLLGTAFGLGSFITVCICFCWICCSSSLWTFWSCAVSGSVLWSTSFLYS